MSKRTQSFNWVLDPGKFLSEEEAKKLLETAKERAQFAVAQGRKIPVRNYFIVDLAMDFRHDPHVFDIDDQFMFGPAILVNPITMPKATFRKVYLPVGPHWYNFWTGKKYSGGQTLQVPSALDEIPLFVKAGRSFNTPPSPLIL